MRVTVTEDVEAFMPEVPGASGSLIRTGPTIDDTRIVIHDVGVAHLARLEFGFPVLGEAVAHESSIVVAHMLQVPSPGRWDGVELRPGVSFVYPPEADHAAVDPAGLRFALAAVPWDQFTSAATVLDVDPDLAGRRRRAITEPPPAESLGWLEPLQVHRLDGGPIHDLHVGEAVLDSLVRMLAGPAGEPARRRRRRWEDADLVHESVSFLGSTGTWRVPVLTLCRHVGVSERRLLVAFQNVFEMGPHRFMQLRALQASNLALQAASPSEATVGSVAAAHGFAHPGRFARDYAAAFGEPPSRTLRRPDPARRRPAHPVRR